jgi:hypothetical protein
MRLADFCPFHRVAFLVPAYDALVENFHVAVTLFVENAVGQTGQVMGASSIQDDRSILGNALHISIELRQRRGERAQDMRFAIFFLAAHIDDHGFLSRRDLLHQLVDGYE